MSNSQAVQQEAYNASDDPFNHEVPHTPGDPLGDSKAVISPADFLGKRTAPAAASAKKGSLNPEEFISQSVPAAASGAKSGKGVSLIDPKSAKVFFRVRPGEEWHRFGLDVLFPEGSDITKAMLIDPNFDLPAEFEEYVRPANLFLIHDHKAQTNFYLFPDSTNSWHVSRYDTAIEAENTWLKLRSSRADNQYVAVYPATASVLHKTEPKWPDGTFNEMFNACFGERIIRTADDPVLLSLAGMTYGK